MSKLLNAKLIMTVLLGALYFGGLIWALVHDKLDINSYTQGIGPLFGLAWAWWFNDKAPPDKGSSS
ncbi:MAG: hypothetical protein ABIK08_11435 [Pseudomonadota bacterium]